MPDLISQLKETTAFIRSQYPHTPEAGIVLGSGLGDFADQIQIEKEIDYKEIPHFPVSTVEGHKGKMIFGELSGKKVVAMAGRFHYYEGYSVQEVTFPVRVLKYLGIKCLFLSNAAGGVNPAYKVGDLMIINDHISFGTMNPLIGKNYDELGPRFPDMTEPYKKELIEKAKSIAARLKIPVHVGMSTVQENIVAVHMGLPVFAMSVITDLGLGDHEKITHEEVLKAAREAEPKLAAIFKQMIAEL
jgi:purine-nucleoside phosphorylase